MRFFRVDDQHPFTGRHMLAITCLFFGVIIAVNMVMAFAATGTFPGLVVENSYVSSQHYDEMLAKARAQDKVGWQPQLTADRGTLRFILADAKGQRVPALGVSAHVGRPSTTREDRFIEFDPVADTAYAARETLPPGLWEIDLEASRGGEVVFRQTQEIFLKPSEATQ
jgi:nitrogen fixation protein FixH